MLLKLAKSINKNQTGNITKYENLTYFVEEIFSILAYDLCLINGKLEENKLPALQKCKILTKYPLNSLGYRLVAM